MKSLDILNRVIQSYQKCFIIGSLEEADKLSCLEMVKIKQDLEVLEIIREKKVNMGWLMFLIKGGVKLKDIEQIYPKDGDTPLILEELLKLKQWLEENENENI